MSKLFLNYLLSVLMFMSYFPSWAQSELKSVPDDRFAEIMKIRAKIVEAKENLQRENALSSQTLQLIDDFLQWEEESLSKPVSEWPDDFEFYLWQEKISKAIEQEISNKKVLH